MYKIIVYELIIFEVKQANNRTIKKRYFQKIKTIHNVNIKDLSKIMIDLKQRFCDNKYVIDFMSPNEFNLIAKMNEKSEKAYRDFILKGGKII